VTAGRPAESAVERDSAEREAAERVVITDKRKVRRDGSEPAAAPEQAQQSAGGNGSTAPAEAPPSDDTAALLAERTADLQRLQADYANYRRRAERDRAVAGDLAVGRVLVSLLPILDDLDRARAHGDLTGALKAVADKLDGTFTSLGLARFGEAGDPFDPAIHDAVMHDVSPDVSVPTCTTLLRSGYRHHDRLLRPAMVGVTDPAPAGAGVDTPVDTLTDATASATAPDAPDPETQTAPDAGTIPEADETQG
jgi:molecular chaperone GrpE